jgi:hypothetical protein
VFSPRLVLTAATALAATGLLLAGCSAAAAPSTQTAKQACSVLSGDLASSATELSTAFSSIQTDPQGAETALAKFDASLKKSTTKVTNSKIKTAAANTSKAIDAMDSDLKSYIKDSSRTAGLQASATQVQNTFGKLGTLCTA